MQAAPASADHHLMKIREVKPSTSAGANDGFIELQMTAGGQNLVADHDVVTYNAAAMAIHTFEFPTTVPNGNDQRTILIGEGAAGTPDFTDTDLNMPPAGGGACFISDEFGAIDCVTWGNFVGDLPGPTGTPASPAGVTAGKSLTRSITQGCNLKLDDPDDSESSSVDFTETDPSPRNNSVVPTETNCPTPPNTVLDTDGVPDPLPAQFTNQTTVRFNFSSTGGTGPVTFECRLDTEPSFSACTGGVTKQYTDIPEGARTFQVRATASGQTDPSPATHQWTVDTTDPNTSITANPTDPSTAGVQFSFTSTEPTNATFRCQMDALPEEACTSAKSYNLPSGEHTFTVAAIDRAGNRDDTPATYTWDVDATPPTTDITSAPDDPSTVNTADFTFTSELGATFTCKLDDAPATACNSGSVGYTALNDGEHTFRVRATDSLGNVETVENTNPGGNTYTWTVDATSDPPPQTEITKAPKRKGTDRTPKVTFRAVPATGASFQCRVDDEPYEECTSPHTTAKLKFGKHTFEVFATGPGGEDTTPAKASFKIVKRR